MAYQWRISPRGPSRSVDSVTLFGVALDPSGRPLPLARFLITDNSMVLIITRGAYGQSLMTAKQAYSLLLTAPVFTTFFKRSMIATLEWLRCCHNHRNPEGLDIEVYELVNKEFHFRPVWPTVDPKLPGK